MPETYLQVFRRQFPQYNDMPDSTLMKNIHQTWYSDMDWQDFTRRISQPISVPVTPAIKSITSSPQSKNVFIDAIRKIESFASDAINSAMSIINAWSEGTRAAQPPTVREAQDVLISSEIGRVLDKYMPRQEIESNMPVAEKEVAGALNLIRGAIDLSLIPVHLAENPVESIAEMTLGAPQFISEGLTNLSGTLQGMPEFEKKFYEHPEQSALALHLLGTVMSPRVLRPKVAINETPKAPGSIPFYAQEIGIVPKEYLATEKLVKESRALTGKVHNIFTRYRELEEIPRRAFVEIEEIQPQLQRDAVMRAMEIVGKYPEADRLAIRLWIEEPKTYELSDHLRDAADKILEIQEWSYREMEKRGYPPGRWPETQINHNLAQIAKLKEKDADPVLIEELKAHNKKLKSIRYLHRITRNPLKITRLRGWLKRKKLSSKPYGFQGRVFDTAREAEAAGYEVGDITESLAHQIYETQRMIHIDDLIKQINKNSEYSRTAAQISKFGKPKDWRTVSPQLFPKGRQVFVKGEKVSFANRYYHPAIADAIEELTWAHKPHLLVRAYDNLNTAFKMITFYNPVFMSHYDMYQGWRGAGMRYFKEIPAAIKDFTTKSKLYKEFEKAGLYNNVIDYRPALEYMVKGALDRAHKSKGMRVALQLEKWIGNPLSFLKDWWLFHNKITWGLDQIWRTALARALISKDFPHTKGMSRWARIDLANDFMANYGKVPKETRKILNRVIFTPTYKISMFRVLKRMWEDPVKYRGPLARHYAYKTFMRFALPALVSQVAYNWYGNKIKATSQKGYQLVVEDGNRDTVFSFSNPLLEETKIFHRPIPLTIKFNLSAGMHILTTLVNQGMKIYHNGEDIDAVKTLNQWAKIGWPGLRELEVWRDQDLESYQKFMTTFGLAYIYHRKGRKNIEDDRYFWIKALDAMDLWINAHTMLGINKTK